MDSLDSPKLSVSNVGWVMCGFVLRLQNSGWQNFPMTAGKRWTRNELLVALNLYHKLTFGQMHQQTSAIVHLAAKLGRTPSSLAMKLSNFASLDPALLIRGIKGLSGASNLDREIWDEFHQNLNELAPVSEEELRKVVGAQETDDVEILPESGVRISHNSTYSTSEITEKTGWVKVRRGQDYFRNAVVNNFGSKCGVTQLAIRELLIASHILPWSKHPGERLKIQNGLCLSRLHDAAFDQGLIAFDDELKLILSPRLKAALPDRAITENFEAYEGQMLNLPNDSVLPDSEFLAEHRTNIFRSK